MMIFTLLRDARRGRVLFVAARPPDYFGCYWIFQTQRQTAGVLFVLLVIRLWLLLLLGYALLLFGRLIN